MGLFSKIKNAFIKQEEKEDKKLTEIEKEEKIETEKYISGLSKSRDNFVNKLSLLGIKYTKINDEFYDELEEILITADVGINTVMSFTDRLRKRVKSENITDFEYLKEVIVDELLMIYVGNDILTSKLSLKDNELNVVLFVGVNGVGKTTSIAKIANKLKKDNKKVCFVGDGINDTVSLVKSDIGVSMGNLGSDAAIEASDVVIVNDDISKIETAIKMSKFTGKIIKQNLIFAISIKILFLSLGLFGIATMWQAVFADVGVTVLTILNSIRILNK